MSKNVAGFLVFTLLVVGYATFQLLKRNRLGLLYLGHSKLWALALLPAGFWTVFRAFFAFDSGKIDWSTKRRAGILYANSDPLGFWLQTSLVFALGIVLLTLCFYIFLEPKAKAQDPD